MILLLTACDEKQRINSVTEFPRKIVFSILFNILIYWLLSLGLFLLFQLSQYLCFLPSSDTQVWNSMWFRH